MTEIPVGATGEVTQTVTPELTAARFGSGLVEAYSTPALIALMEGAAAAALASYLPEGQTSVGVEVNIRHLAATPVGMRVVARARLIESQGRRFKFDVEAFDEVEQIGVGVHVRSVIDQARFEQRVAAKLAQRGGG